MKKLFRVHPKTPYSLPKVFSPPHPNPLPPLGGRGDKRKELLAKAIILANGSSSPPWKKGDLGGFTKAYKIPPQPPFYQGGSFKGGHIGPP
jgi:hypothetical protein